MRKVNSVEIAKLAGVSRSTVSRVINNYPNVPESTRRKVMEVIQEHNYYPNISARVLAGKKTGTIGLFMIESGPVSDDPLSSFFITSIIDSASTKGYYVLTNFIRDRQDYNTIERLKEVFYQRRIDGGIFIGADNYEPMIEELIKEGFIIGIVDQSLPGANEPNRIVSNFPNEEGVAKAIDYLVDLGHKNIGIINGDMNRIAGPQKFQGYLNGMKKNDLKVNNDWVLKGNFSRKSGYEAIKKLLEKKVALPSAFIAANDSNAFGVIQALQEHSIKVPDDISVIGFDDHMLSAFSNPSLTTVRVNFTEMMQKLTENMILAVEGKQVDSNHYVSDTELIIRNSCKSIN
ncbi:LacI family DNA-binding transcriptional regulator [Bacillus sp. FJAT-49711]|uniref:LacI family DNA-binding transcriptional regulator n=1 Tax=Bacillus sp. FJAT-49711 TaxID=2833585 RepID=UPI001BCA08ED|nr:LacI family DNA-binding transcriptional regulator [Bacillus sp. FJAT-49711]MBS4218349.1 LacI family DNA-binding transcriptional regulator [Bacillus sp. FJAT-49711]